MVPSLAVSPDSDWSHFSFRTNMPSQTFDRLLAFSTVAIVAFALGHLAFDDSESVRRLQTQIKAMEQEPSLQHFSKGLRDSQRTNAPQTPHSAPIFGQDESDLSLDIASRAKKGEYILNYEPPEIKKAMEQLRRDAVAARSQTNAPEYVQRFAELGIAPETGQKLIKHIEKIHQSSLEAESANQQLALAKDDYKKKLQSLLGDDKYDRYVFYEQEKRASQELELLNQFASQRDVLLNSDQIERLTSIIRDSGAFTERSWHAPYDDLPKFVIGKNEVITEMQNEIAGVESGVQRILQRAPEYGLPEEDVLFLKEYYASRIRQRELLIEKVNLINNDPHTEHHPPFFGSVRTTPPTH